MIMLAGINIYLDRYIAAGMASCIKSDGNEQLRVIHSKLIRSWLLCNGKYSYLFHFTHIISKNNVKGSWIEIWLINHLPP